MITVGDGEKTGVARRRPGRTTRGALL